MTGSSATTLPITTSVIPRRLSLPTAACLPCITRKCRATKNARCSGRAGDCRERHDHSCQETATAVGNDLADADVERKSSSVADAGLRTAGLSIGRRRTILPTHGTCRLRGLEQGNPEAMALEDS